MGAGIIASTNTVDRLLVGAGAIAAKRVSTALSTANQLPDDIQRGAETGMEIAL
jgi:hypothetical protein